MSKDNTAIESHNRLVAGTKVKGEITTENDIRIDGIFEGDIVCNRKIVIGAKGVINGTAKCANAEIIGTFNGNIEVTDTLIVQSTGRIEGDITTSILVVEPNAFFNGSCTMKEAKGTENGNSKK